MPRITKTLVDDLKPGNRDRFIHDDIVAGFGVKITPRGRKVFVLDYSTGRGSRRYTIGKYADPWTVHNARKEAERLRGSIVLGGDPAADKRASKIGDTMRKALVRFDAQYIETRLKPRSATEYRRLIAKTIAPAVGDLKIKAVQKTDITRLNRSLVGTPYGANRVLSVLSKFFAWLEEQGARPAGSNPCIGVKRNREKARERFLSPAEMARLSVALDAEAASGTTPYAIAALRLLILTGARKNEILTLRWEHVDLDASCLRLPDSKTGAKIVYLSPAAVDLMKDIPRIVGNPHVIAGARAGGRLIGLQRIWTTVRERAGLGDVRVHDLRHSFASMAIGDGMSLPMLGKLLGHKSVFATARYAHLADDPVRAAADQVGNSIAEAMTGRQPLRDRRPAPDNE